MKNTAQVVGSTIIANIAYLIFIDLLKSSRAITTNKVVYKMHELAYKLEVEKRVKAASERLEQLGMNAKDGNEESSEKVVLLKRALQKYQGLYLPNQGTPSSFFTCDRTEWLIGQWGSLTSKGIASFIRRRRDIIAWRSSTAPHDG